MFFQGFYSTQFRNAKEHQELSVQFNGFATNALQCPDLIWLDNSSGRALHLCLRGRELSAVQAQLHLGVSDVHN